MARGAGRIRSFRGQFLTQTVVVCAGALALLTLALLTWSAIGVRSGVIGQVEQAADILAASTQSIVERRDGRLADQLLGSFAANSLIASIHLEGADGKTIATYPADQANAASPAESSSGLLGPVVARRNVVKSAGGPAIGAVVIASRSDVITGPIARDAAVALGTCMLTGLAAFLILRRKREALVDAPLRLASHVGRIVAIGHYRDRVEKPGQEEFDGLADHVNQLLGRLEQHDRTVADLKVQTARQLEEHQKTVETTLESQRQAMKELVLAKAAAEETSLAKSAFLFNMSHELRTPLNAIMGYSELLLEGAGDDNAEQRTRDTTKILGAGRHLLTLINAVLDLSKIEAGKVEIDLETVDVVLLLRDAACTAEPLAAAQRNVLTLDLADDLGTIQTDSTKVRQVLLNLLGNAAKFTTGGTITLEARRERELADWLVIRVKDTGIGMSPEEQQGLFREFKQGQAALERPERGSGLGLAISQALCQLLGGAISVESSVGVGSTFTVRIPAQVRQTKDGRPRPLPTAGHTDDASRPAVLVIDQDAGARELVRRVVERAGLRTIEATSASDGYRFAVIHEPLAIVLEVALAGQNGWHLLERLVQIPVVNKAPVIVVSIDDNKGRSAALGAVAHFTKPVPTQQLFSVLKDLAGATSPRPAVPAV
jgi:signal transduction histidine kinase/CheY-like chemotaxis protein